MDIKMRSDRFLEALRALAEPTRLRLIALLAESELTVSDMVEILGQSQPRLSRHLKLLSDAGLLDRSPEALVPGDALMRLRGGSWVCARGEGARSPAPVAAAGLVLVEPHVRPLS